LLFCFIKFINKEDGGMTHPLPPLKRGVKMSPLERGFRGVYSIEM
jgi:hypothetical protein